MSLTVLEVVTRLPGELQARLEGDAYFADVPVVLAEDGDPLAELARKEAVLTTKGGKRGAAVIVLPLILDDAYPEQGAGPMILRPAFQVLENIDLNRDSNGTGKSLRAICRRIVQLVKPLALYGLVSDFRCDTPAIEPLNLEADLGAHIRAAQVNFFAYEIGESPAQVGTPLPSEDNGSLVLTCATTGAEIWYTTDDSYPRPLGETAVLYTGPIAIAADFTLRACAYPVDGTESEGLIPSQVYRGEITV
jgi:hypothetical protein